jgi:hypothetical protein
MGRRNRADFTDLAGQWTPDTAFDEIVASQRPRNGGPVRPSFRSTQAAGTPVLDNDV